MKDLENRNLNELESPTPEGVISEGIKSSYKTTDDKAIDVNKSLNAPEMDEKPPVERPQMALDDAARIKVLSPSMLVFKRFIRNKLAIIGTFILVFMFAFAFLGGWVGRYKEDDVFYKYDQMISEYGIASLRTRLSNYEISDSQLDYHIIDASNTIVSEKLKDTDVYTTVGIDKNIYTVKREGEYLYIISKSDTAPVCTALQLSELTFTFEENKTEFNVGAFKSRVSSAINASATKFEYNLSNFVIEKSGKSYFVRQVSDPYEVVLSTPLVFDLYNLNDSLSDNLKFTAYRNLYSGNAFEVDDVNYQITLDTETNLFILNRLNSENQLTPYANLTDFVVRRYDGQNSIELDFKLKIKEFINEMQQNNVYNDTFNYSENDSEAENGITESFMIEKEPTGYVIRNVQTKYLIDISSAPSKEHFLGTDSNGMDVFTRMMYGGRISLLIGFIVIFIELAIGVVLGGIAGYFGKWIDNLIMRIVDIFNCIPFIPIMVILGSVFDKMQMEARLRIVWLMVIMGILGWPSIARLVRGQILSLREQEFMIAAEATGLSAGRRIFKHLIPNVMPQLIVNATMGLGGIILTESTLSFLGLGAKFPMATWGAMINSVSTANDLQLYTYIWIPIGVLICLTVIAFNFVGDGLRDAFDPKMKR